MQSSTSNYLFHLSTKILVGTVWLSATLFGLYILFFYFASLIMEETLRWNTVLPGLYDDRTPAATAGMGLHFAAGGIILVLGCIQLLSSVRERYPAWHRWLGRVYVTAAILTAIGGLVFIFRKGTIGGTVMNVAFAGYGLLMLVAALQTIRYARAEKFTQHRAWAIRLFALAIGSWLYRMDYGFWFLFTDDLGHTGDFRGPFDYFMDFWFYLPNLLVAEIFIARRGALKSPVARGIATLLIVLATLFLLLATYYFTAKLWWPSVADLMTGQPVGG
ncbi:DUF2306 domain-containing protein [Lewinella sp. W8]|uniref:DUF2306 domain-containing protein n=1 Tax=Lewinella sp. W8 TaxID=2528208 RepID=UPI0010679E43|nr:DUF2306 domain-containing protein [Lewinella sp. W8]MTB51445.1 DUF2306 domain-containing protein [Lewinella sp. W8]